LNLSIQKLEKDRKKAEAAASDQEDTSEDDEPNTSKGRQKRNKEQGTASDFVGFSFF
jgi:hypothetical protein